MSLTWLSWSVTSDVISFWVTTLMSEGLPCFDARFTDLRCVFSTDVLLFICDSSSFSSWSSCNSCMLFLAWRHHPAQWTVSHPYHAQFIYLIFQPLEVVDRGPQVVENYAYLFNLRSNMVLMFKHQFNSRYQWFDRLIKQVKNDNSRDQRDGG